MKFFLLILLFSCSSYINRMHSKMEKEDDAKNSQKGNFEFYKGKKSTVSTSNKINSPPPVKRKYNGHPNKRINASDFVSNAHEGSLWHENADGNFLFSKNIRKKNGDIIVVLIQNKLKNEITLELSRMYPVNIKIPKKDKEKAPPTTVDSNKIYDRIPGVIVEEINQGHILIRARKDVLFNRRKRKIELEILLSRKDISDKNTFPSSKALEFNIQVVR